MRERGNGVWEARARRDCLFLRCQSLRHGQGTRWRAEVARDSDRKSIFSGQDQNDLRKGEKKKDSLCRTGPWKTACQGPSIVWVPLPVPKQGDLGPAIVRNKNLWCCCQSVLWFPRVWWSGACRVALESQAAKGVGVPEAWPRNDVSSVKPGAAPCARPCDQPWSEEGN
jgi:hypothetical protein